MTRSDSAKYGLALHTTSPQLGLAFSNFNNDRRIQVWDLGRELSSHLHSYLAEFMQPQTWQDVAFIAVAKGPGGFTGTRIGMVTARTLAQQLDLPIFPISTLAAVAEAEKTAYAGQYLAVQMNARRDELFVAIYTVSEDGLRLTEILPDTTLKPEKWQETLEDLKTDYSLIHAPSLLGCTVSGVLNLACNDWKQGKLSHWSQALPFYGQHPV